MKRAAILIGVDKTGDLPRLRDAARGAKLMQTWATAQGMDPVHLFTDEKEPVTVDAIKKAIRELVAAANVSQLLVYFAGHGVNLQRQEYWLLSDAPGDTQAAVNLATSSALAATCGIPHVVFVSDACRTAPEGIRAQSVRGSEIFPNLENDTAPVDQFFACQLGRPSHEVRDAAVTSAEFSALYTTELVPALLGRREQIVEWVDDAGARFGHVRLRPLRDFMSSAVGARLAALNLQSKVIQVPVAQISSDPPLWLSRFKADAGAALGFNPPRGRSAPPAVVSPESITARLLRETLTPAAAVPPAPLSVPAQPRSAGAGSAAPPGESDLARAAQVLATPFGPGHHETMCGFKLRGALVVDFVSNGARCEFVTHNTARGADLRVVDVARPSASVLLVLDSGAGVLLPAIPDYLCGLSFVDGELIDVAYEPSDNSKRWTDFKYDAREVRSLRAIASAATSRGSFKLDGADALHIAQKMQTYKVIDPALAIYAAYAYHDLQRRALIRDMAGYMSGQFGAVMFDVALLGRLLDANTPPVQRRPLLSPLPLLAQGWTFLRAFGVPLPQGLDALFEMRLPSLWTLFDARGVERLRHAIAQGVIR
jgi:hypothetical protein